MFTSIFFKALQLFVVTLIVLNLTLSAALAQNSNPPNQTPSSQSTPAPTPSAQEGKDKQPPVSKNTGQSGPADPYAKYHKAIKKYNEEVYGKRG